VSMRAGLFYEQAISCTFRITKALWRPKWSLETCEPLPPSIL
jgi:hypothetical protein